MHDLTMVKIDPTTDKGEQTRRQIFESALQLFRERGFDSKVLLLLRQADLLSGSEGNP
jgi:hypothetical protein